MLNQPDRPGKQPNNGIRKLLGRCSTEAHGCVLMNYTARCCKSSSFFSASILFPPEERVHMHSFLEVKCDKKVPVS